MRIRISYSLLLAVLKEMKLIIVNQINLHSTDSTSVFASITNYALMKLSHFEIQSSSIKRNEK